MRQDLPIFAAGLDFMLDDNKFFRICKGMNFCLCYRSAIFHTAFIIYYLLVLVWLLLRSLNPVRRIDIMIVRVALP